MDNKLSALCRRQGSGSKEALRTKPPIPMLNPSPSTRLQCNMLLFAGHGAQHESAAELLQTANEAAGVLAM
jgi:hypothetical protein